MSVVNRTGIAVKPALDKRSAVFKHFGFLYYKDKLLDQNHYYCSLCVDTLCIKNPEINKNIDEADLSVFFRYKISVSTSSLHSHLYNKHQIDSRSDNRAASSGAQDTLKGFFKITKTSKTHSKAASLPGDIFLWFAHALLPHNTIEDEGTKLFLGKYLGISPEQIPGRNAIERAGMKVYKEMHATIKTMLADDDHLSGATTFDIWTDQYSRRSFIGMTYHYIDQLFTLSKALLSATEFPHPHNYETINDWVQNVFSEYDLQRSRVHVTDEASNNVKFARVSGELRMGCDSHGLHHLITTDAVKKNQKSLEVIDKCKKIVAALKWRKDVVQSLVEDKLSKGKLAIFEEAEMAQRLLDIDDQYATGQESTPNTDTLRQGPVTVRRLAQECPTRWTSLYKLLTTVHDSYSGIKEVLVEMDKPSLFLLKTEIATLAELIKFLKEFDCYTYFVQGNFENSGSLSTSILMREHLYDIILPKTGDSDMIKDLKSKMMLQWDKRLPSTGLHYLAAFLDPSLKKLRSLEDFIKTQGSIIQFVLAILEEMGIDVHKIVPKLPSEPVEIVALDTPSSSKRDERYKKREQLIRKFSSESSEYDDTAEGRLRSELTSYQTESIDLGQFELMPWWQSKQQTYPMLAAIFRSVHCIPATSADIERVWSVSGLIISSRRSRIGSNNFKHQLYVHENWDMAKSSIDKVI